LFRSRNEVESPSRIASDEAQCISSLIYLEHESTNPEKTHTFSGIHHVDANHRSFNVGFEENPDHGIFLTVRCWNQNKQIGGGTIFASTFLYPGDIKNLLKAKDKDGRVKMNLKCLRCPYHHSTTLQLLMEKSERSRTSWTVVSVSFVFGDNIFQSFKNWFK
jgi:hypothetical protein